LYQWESLLLSMTKTTKILLLISLLAFALGFTGIVWWFGVPIGAIFFGLFLISKMMEKEAALFDAEQRRKVALAEAAKRCASPHPCAEQPPGHDAQFHAARAS
jgi:hypothetical protein